MKFNVMLNISEYELLKLVKLMGKVNFELNKVVFLNNLIIFVLY